MRMSVLPLPVEQLAAGVAFEVRVETDEQQVPDLLLFEFGREWRGALQRVTLIT